MSRFDHVKYDEQALRSIALFKASYEEIAKQIELGPDGRAKFLALTALE